MSEWETISSEELLSYVNDLIEELEQKGVPEEDLWVGSLDAEALYPSSDIKDCARICRERVRESPIQFEGVDPRWAAMYIALNWEQHDITRAGSVVSACVFFFRCKNSGLT